MGSIIAAILAIAAAGVNAGLSAKQQKEAQSEERELAGIQRSDTLAQRKKEEFAARRDLKLNESKIVHERSMAFKEADLLRENEKTMKEDSARESLTQAASRLKDKPVESFLFKKKNVERFGL